MGEAEAELGLGARWSVDTKVLFGEGSRQEGAGEAVRRAVVGEEDGEGEGEGGSLRELGVEKVGGLNFVPQWWDLDAPKTSPVGPGSFIRRVDLGSLGEVRTRLQEPSLLRANRGRTMHGSVHISPLGISSMFSRIV